MDSTPFANVTDYADRYGPTEDNEHLSVLLGDASDMLLSAYEAYWGTPYVSGEHQAFDRAACAVCCAMVQRVVSVPGGFAGATQLSQGAAGYTASVSFGGALGDHYITKSETKRLGLSGASMGSLHPVMRDA